MSSSRESIHNRCVSTPKPLPLSAYLAPVAGAPSVRDRPVQHASCPFDDAIEALLSYIARAGWPAAIAASVAGAHAFGEQTRRMLGLIAVLPFGGDTLAFALGWSPADLSVARSFAASLRPVVRQSAAQASGIRHLAISEGVVEPLARESAAERELRSRRQWSKPLDQLLAERKAVA